MNLRKLLPLITILLALIFTLPANAAVVKTEKTAAGWRLLVDDQPFLIKGVCFSPTTIGETSENNSRRNWMHVDDDGDGRNDFAFQTWVDANKNNQRDLEENEVGDFALLREMGANTIRIYHHESDDAELAQVNGDSSRVSVGVPQKELLRKLHADYGIWVAMGDLFGAYTIGTDAGWATGTDYRDPKQRQSILHSVEVMVNDHKDEPYLLLWVLGNENNFAQFTHTNADRFPKEYATLLNEAAQLIHRLDGKHPVALSNGGPGMLEAYAKWAPAIDIFGLNFYQDGAFYFWEQIEKAYDRPVVLTEYGQCCPEVKDGITNEERQAQILRRNWLDISGHSLDGKLKPCNSIGGFLFEWVDNWWHDGVPLEQNTNPQPNGWNHEYIALISMGNGAQGSLVRQLKKSYFMQKELWADPIGGVLAEPIDHQ